MIRDLLHLLEQPHVRSLAGGLPAAEAIPVDRLRAAVTRVLDQPGRYGPPALQYGPTEGAPVLREIVAAAAGAADGRTATEHVLITTGSQQALDLLARSLIDPGDPVVVEHPAYLGALQSFLAAGARIVELPSDQDGLRTDVVEERLRSGFRPKAVTVVPNFQNPTGATMAPERRAHLAALAERYGFVVIEDDPYRALRFDGDELPPLRSYTDLAITLGSSSKVLAPGLRVGWLAAPAELTRALVRVKQSADLHTPALNQLVVADVLSDRTFTEDHVAGLRGLYFRRCRALTDALRALFGDRIEFVEPDGGFFVWARLHGIDTAGLLPAALERGVAYVPGSEFTTEPGALSDRMRMSFASLRPHELTEAVERLAVAATESSVAAYLPRHADHRRPRGRQRAAAHELGAAHRARD